MHSDRKEKQISDKTISQATFDGYNCLVFADVRKIEAQKPSVPDSPPT